ncbi:site-specific integrase [Lentibacillus cibarius]|uniref:Site-specific integrase n=1 Tax=Lentibacillus cibarius TaxID=2583219 RepID=A0A549YA91_9BACI|nr:site-specific integrase [Lentibacillus cibarius]TRM08779.1 site-specific integrase [Lentibacillus cibarius]TRM08807.1 site-specific integrase [Lentibacillus cibarius]TRM12881.1 site-specific integrase [Lentibacillus cibarius]
MASFQRRGKTWQYTVSRTVNGKQKPLRKGGFRTKKEAQVAAAEVEADLRKGVVPQLTAIPFSDYFESWLNTFKTDIANNTLERYFNSLQVIKEHFGDLPIQEINKRSYQAFLNEYGQTHAKASSRKLNTHIRACVRDAIDEGMIRVDFTRDAVFTGDAGKKSSEKHLGYEDSKRLLQLIHKRLDISMTYYLLLLAITSGMRFGELVGLTRKDFNFFNNTINIDKSWGYTKSMHEGFGPTKNEDSVRLVKMDAETMNVFKQLFKSTPDNIYQLIFYSPSSKYNVISNSAANKVLIGMLDQLGTNRITVHGLRHTHASVLLYQGVSVYYVSKRLGHSDIDTTLNTYSHVIKEMEQRDEQKSADVFQKMLV